MEGHGNADTYDPASHAYILGPWESMAQRSAGQ